MSKAISTFLRGNSKDTVIVLLGWAAAKDDHLEKYSKLYQERGFDSIRYTAPLPEKFRPKLKDCRDVKSVANELRSILDVKDFVFHLFSMNGVITLCSLALQYPELHVLQRTRGILFDSGPASVGKASIPIYMDLLDQVSQNDNMKREGLSKIKYELNKKILSAKMHHQYAKESVMDEQGIDIGQYNAYNFLLCNPDLPKILYFVYSDIDRICPAIETREFANYQRQVGKLVVELQFQDSDHVQHYRKHPEEYNTLIDSFLDAIQVKSRL